MDNKDIELIQQMENQLNLEVVSNEDVMTINGGQNMSMNDGISTWFRLV